VFWQQTRPELNIGFGPIKVPEIFGLMLYELGVPPKEKPVKLEIYRELIKTIYS